jgi:hypothetical protein
LIESSSPDDEYVQSFLQEKLRPPPIILDDSQDVEQSGGEKLASSATVTHMVSVTTTPGPAPSGTTFASCSSAPPTVGTGNSKGMPPESISEHNSQAQNKEFTRFFKGIQANKPKPNPGTMLGTPSFKWPPTDLDHVWDGDETGSQVFYKSYQLNEL